MVETLVQEVEDAPETKEEFREQRRRKRNTSDDQATQAKKSSTGRTNPSPDGKAEPRLRNFYAPLRATMDLEETGGDQQEPSSQAGRPLPIILTSATNLLQLQKKLRGLAKGNFEFRTSRNGTRVVTREMADFSAVKAYFTSENLSFYTFFPKSLKPVKPVIRHLPSVTPAEDISEALTDLGYYVVSVKEMSSARRTKEEGSQPKILPLFLITLPRTEKSLEIFKLSYRS
jgi:hypothetical protein